MVIVLWNPPTQICRWHRNDIQSFHYLNNNMATQTNQNQLIIPSKGEIILYQTADGRTSIDVKLENETVWLSSEQMALLFERDRTVIQRHIRNIYSEGELTRETTCAKFAHMGRDGDQTYVTELFNLDVIISVGYRVKSQRGTQFRIWANSVLKEYLIKGYAIKNDLVQQKYDDSRPLWKLWAARWDTWTPLQTIRFDPSSMWSRTILMPWTPWIVMTTRTWE